MGGGGNAPFFFQQNPTWGNQTQAVLDLCPGPTPLSISVSIRSIPKPFGVGLV